MTSNDFPSWPSFTMEEAEAVKDILLSNKVNYWTGNECRKFENEFAAWTGSRYAVALANGTLALDIAFKAIGIGEGDEVIVTSRTYIASVSSIINSGATPVFIDVDSESQNIDPKNLSKVISNKTRAILCVHLAGWPCDMDEIMTFAKNYNLFVIEDCAQAHGAKYKGKSVGSIGHIGCWSFCQDKIMTTGGEGGMVTTNNKSFWEKMWAYKDHGKSYKAVYEQDHPNGFRWLHESFGSNWRMTEMQAAIGRIQLKRMSQWTYLRNRNAEILNENFKKYTGQGKILRIPEMKCKSCTSSEDDICKSSCTHAYYKYYIFLQPNAISPGWNQDRIIEEINAKGVPCFHGSCSEVYLEKAFQGTCFKPNKRLPVARNLAETSLMLLVHPSLSDNNILKMAKIVMTVLDEAQI